MNVSRAPVLAAIAGDIRAFAPGDLPLSSFRALSPVLCSCWAHAWYPLKPRFQPNFPKMVKY